MCSERPQETATPAIATLCEAMRPIRCPSRPASNAAASGSSTMARSTWGFTRVLTFQGVEVFDIDGAALAEQHDEDRKADGGLCCRDRQYEEYENLATQIAEITR